MRRSAGGRLPGGWYSDLSNELLSRGFGHLLALGERREVLADERERMRVDADFFDAKIAGWWAWGLCAWIGSGWCDARRYRDGTAGRGVNRQLPHLSTAYGTGLRSLAKEYSYLAIDLSPPAVDVTGALGAAQAASLRDLSWAEIDKERR